MCGIVGYVGERKAAEVLIEGLRRLEYRGYDSAGIAVRENGKVKVIKTRGKISHLETLVQQESVNGSIGIGHTRWATHGKPSDINAHPHVSGAVAIVHNGIVENYRELREELEREGIRCISETDTEVISHLVAREYARCGDPCEAVTKALKNVEGSYAIVALFEDRNILIGARRGAPLVVGHGEKEHFLASDVTALLPFTRNVTFLEDGDVAVVKNNNVEIFDSEGMMVHREQRHLDWTPAMAEKGGYKHFMLKEIHEQPEALSNTIRPRILQHEPYITLDDLPARELARSNRIVFVACGTSWHACLLGRVYMEGLAGIPSWVELASEFRYGTTPIDENTLVVAVSQSGETADTLESVREARRRGATVLAITNVVGSTITREAQHTLFTWAGPEIGVASTKTFTAQVAALLLLALALGWHKGRLDKPALKDITQHVLEIPRTVHRALEEESHIEEVARRYFRYQNFLFLGRGLSWPVAMEGALKLKEISYIHAEAYAAGEMKHGPLALVDENMPSVFFLHNDHTAVKTMSNMEEIKAREGKIIAFSTFTSEKLAALADDIITVHLEEALISPFALSPLLQLFAYHVAVLRGTDVDQPRNLAKSVTVE